MQKGMQAIRRLVGIVTQEQLRYVDCFVGRDVALFMPVGGQCFYAITPEHTHPAYMFVLTFNDRMETALHGRVHGSRPGSVFALSPGVPHQELPSDEPPRYLCVMIEPRFFARQYRSYSRAKPRFLGESFPAGQDLLPLLKRFMIEADSDMQGSDAVREALSVEICHSIIRSFLRVPARKDRVSDRVEVNRVVEHLHGRLDEKVTVESLAAIARLSPSHFTRVFRTETGKAPMAYVQGLRLERAKKLLLAGDRTISEIALECGFGSSSYLSTCFHKQYRMTPREYQKGMERERKKGK